MLGGLLCRRVPSSIEYPVMYDSDGAGAGRDRECAYTHARGARMDERADGEVAVAVIAGEICGTRCNQRVEKLVKTKCKLCTMNPS